MFVFSKDCVKNEKKLKKPLFLCYFLSSDMSDIFEETSEEPSERALKSLLSAFYFFIPFLKAAQKLFLIGRASKGLKNLFLLPAYK